MIQTEENSLLFSAAKKLPSSIVGWKEYLERIYGSEHVSYRTEFKNMPYDVGFLVHIDSPKISLTQWLGIGKDYKKEFPIQIRISDVKILSSMGLLSPDTRYPTPQAKPVCNRNRCETTFTGLCIDVGCETARVTTYEANIESVDWSFPYD